jgi:hypothetical protein
MGEDEQNRIAFKEKGQICCDGMVIIAFAIILYKLSDSTKECKIPLAYWLKIYCLFWICDLVKKVLLVVTCLAGPVRTVFH